MERECQKDWVLLFYLNGNNELAPEMLKSKLSIEREGADENVDILIQYGSIEDSIVKIIRPRYTAPGSGENSAGVRRYHVDASGSKVAGDLEKANMADPKCLSDFIQWGMKNYPARHYMLVLGGHAYQFVGLMPDYSQNNPYLMSYPEMVNALALACNESEKKIDLLVLDTCYFNRIEMLYELGKEDNPPAQQVLTYIFGGSLSGLPYNDLIRILKINYNVPAHEAVHHIVANLNSDLIAYDINHKKLEDIKSTFHELACCFLANKQNAPMSPFDLLMNQNEKFPWNSIRKDLAKKMPSMTLVYKINSNENPVQCFVSSEYIQNPYKISLYQRLSFARNNSWAKLLYAGNSETISSPENEAGLEPMVLNPSELHAFVTATNPDLGFEQTRQITFDLIAFKGWHWD